MFVEPTVDDFLDCIQQKIDHAIDRTKSGVAQIEATAARDGMPQSGNTIIKIFAEAGKQFDDGIVAVLSDVKRTASRTHLDPHELLQLAARRLMDFAVAVKSATNMHKYRIGQIAPYIDAELLQFDQKLKMSIRQFETGFLNPIESEGSTVNNNIEIGSMVNSAIQQASAHARQDAASTFDVEDANRALVAFERALDHASIPEAVRANISPDLETMRAQFSKTQPSQLILHEAGKSLRNMMESIAAGIMTPSIVQAATSLLRALGIGS